MTWRIANYRVPIVKTWRLGSAADQAEFTRERAAALTADEGLRVLEELRRMRYDDPETPPDLSAFLCCLARHRVRFVVIGAHVLATLGRPRYTDDLDVLVEPTAANARRLAAVFREFGYDELAEQTPGHFIVAERMATLGRPPIAIDVLSSTKGLTFAEAWRGRSILIIEGERVGFLGLNEYVKTKLACGRPKDLLDIELLREIGILDAVVRHRAKRPPAKTGKERAPAKAGKKAAPAQKAPVRRERHRMPADVKRALGSGKALAAYRARPPYQQNDYIGWITRAVRDSTRAQRIAQMLSELAQGNVYMKMKWSGASAKRPAD